MAPAARLALALAAVLAAAGCRVDDAWRLAFDHDPALLRSVPVGRRAVALTLDDGPDAGSTPRILEVLHRHGARATFFLVGERVPGNEGVVAAIAASGHEIANHGARDVPAVDLGPRAFERQLLATHLRLLPFATPRFYRPGSGWIDDWMLPILERHGYTLALGTVYPLDAQLGWEGLTRRAVLWQLDPGDVIILHDGGDRGARTAHVLEELLPELSRRGFRVVTLGELVALADPAPSEETP